MENLQKLSGIHQEIQSENFFEEIEEKREESPDPLQISLVKAQISINTAIPTDTSELTKKVEKYSKFMSDLLTKGTKTVIKKQEIQRMIRLPPSYCETAKSWPHPSSSRKSQTSLCRPSSSTTCCR